MARGGKGDRLRTQAAVGRAEGREEEATAIEPNHADHALRGDPRRIVAEAADMADVVEADKTEGGVLGFVDGNVEGAIDGDDAVGSLAVDDPEHGGVAHDLGLFPADVVILHTAGVAGN